MRTRRLVRRWLTDDGAMVAELADDEVRGSRPDGGEVTFREIEVELAPDADGGLLDEIVERLTAAKRSAERPIPKLVRVLGPAAMQPPDVDITPLPSKPTARQVIQSAFASVGGPTAAPVARGQTRDRSRGGPPGPRGVASDAVGPQDVRTAARRRVVGGSERGARVADR